MVGFGRLFGFVPAWALSWIVFRWFKTNSPKKGGGIIGMAPGSIAIHLAVGPVLIGALYDWQGGVWQAPLYVI